MATPVYLLDGTRLTSTGTAVGGVIPFDGNMLKMPLHVAVNATGQGAYVRLSNDQSAATNADVLVQAGDSVLLSVMGRKFVSVLSVSGTSVVSISALSTGVSGSAASLNLDFTSPEPFDNRITFTRASTATRFNSNGLISSVAANVPRIDYDPITKAIRGLLIEEQRTNLLTYSEQFNDAAWNKIRSSITANTVVAPDGTLTADKLVEDTTATNTHSVWQSPAGLPDSTTHVFSVYAKAAERSRVLVAFMDKAGTTRGMFFDLSAGTVSTYNNNDPSIFGIQNVGNGWYRCWVGQSTSTGALGPRAWVFLTNGTTEIYTGDGTSGVHLWGAQLEAGSFATSYIPTVAAQVTRSADSASMTGTNFSSWYRADEGTLFVEGNQASTPRAQLVALFGAGNHYIRIGGGRAQLSTAGVTFFDVNNSTTATAKQAVAFKVSDYAYSLSGATPTTSTSATAVPTVTQLALQSAFSEYPNGCIRRIAFYPARLSNATLQALTA